MKISRFNPEAVIQQAMRAAEQALHKAAQGQDQVSAQQLPGALKQVADSFGEGQVSRSDVLKAFVQSLESQLSGSLARGEFLPDELGKALDLVNFSQLGIQLQQLVKAQQGPQTLEGAEAAARLALTTADATVTSQLEVFDALQQAAEAHSRENPKGAVAGLLKDFVKERGKLLKKVADTTLNQAEVAHQQVKDPGTKETLQVALQAAIDVHKAVSPRASRLKQLQKQQQTVGTPGSAEQAAQQPFFARFLESQQASQSAMPRITDQTRIGDMVTLKFPSDAEDGGAGESGGDLAVTKKFPSDAEDGGVDEGGVVTEKFPSDAEDGGDGIEGGPGDVMVTRKFPSDNEDGGADEGGRIGDMVTLKFPSDNEDGGTDPVDGGTGGIFVTMKFPSDNEDGGGRPELIPEIAPELRPELRPELIPEIAPEVRPELIPEIAPEVRPELIPEIAPEIRPETGPGDLTRTERDMYATEGAVMKSAFHGTVGIEKRIEEIDNLMMRAMISPEGITSLTREKRVLTAFLGQAPALKDEVKKLEHTLQTARLTPEAYAAVKAELAMYDNIYATLDQLRGVEMGLMNKQGKTPVDHAHLDILSTFLDFGKDGLEKRMDKLANSLAMNPNANDKFLLELEQSCLKHFMYGEEALSGRIAEIDDLMRRARMTQAMSKKLTAERDLCKALLSDLKTFEKRAMVVGDILAGGAPIPEIAPEIRPEVRPELIPEIAPEIRPEVRPELIPEIAPEIRPEVRPELIPEIAPEIRPELIPEIRPEVRPELIPEIAPEVRPEVRPELIPEIAPEIRPEVRPELIPEIAPDLLPDDDDDG